MKIYTVTAGEDARHVFCGTKAEAHTAAKTVPSITWDSVEISERELKLDKDSVISLLNGTPVFEPATQTWGLSSRGGLTKDSPR